MLYNTMLLHASLEGSISYHFTSAFATPGPWLVSGLSKRAIVAKAQALLAGCCCPSSERCTCQRQSRGVQFRVTATDKANGMAPAHGSRCQLAAAGPGEQSFPKGSKAGSCSAVVEPGGTLGECRNMSQATRGQVTHPPPRRYLQEPSPGRCLGLLATPCMRCMHFCEQARFGIKAARPSCPHNPRFVGLGSELRQLNEGLCCQQLCKRRNMRTGKRANVTVAPKRPGAAHFQNKIFCAETGGYKCKKVQETATLPWRKTDCPARWP